MYIDVSMIIFGKVTSIFLVNFWKRGDTFTIQYFVIFGKILVPVLYCMYCVCGVRGGANLSNLKQYPRLLATPKNPGSWGGGVDCT